MQWFRRYFLIIIYKRFKFNKNEFLIYKKATHIMLQVYQKYCIQLKSQLRHGDVQLITDELQTIHFGLKVTSNIVRNILENGHHKSEALLQAVFESAMKLIRAHAAEA